jgi:hypothetical protein
MPGATVGIIWNDQLQDDFGNIRDVLRSDPNSYRCGVLSQEIPSNDFRGNSFAISKMIGSWTTSVTTAANVVRSLTVAVRSTIFEGYPSMIVATEG